MERGKVMLDGGSSATCEYEFSGAGRGSLRLPELMFTTHGETIHAAVLELSDRSHRAVRVIMGPRVGDAEFFIAD